MEIKELLKSNILKTCFVVIVFMIVFTSCSYADPIDGIFKVLENYYPNSNEIVEEITEYESSNYYLDIQKYSSLFDTMKNLASNTNQINNFMFSVNKGVAKITIFILLFAYKVNIFGMLSGYLDMIVDALKVPVYDKTLYMVIGAIGIYAVILSAFANRKTAVMDQTIKTILVVTLALIFMSNPSKYLTQMNDFSIEVSDELFESTYGRYKHISKSDEALISAGKMIWDSMAHKPWQILVLGDTDDNNNTKKLLKLSPYDEEREEIITSLADNNYLLRLDGIPGRFFTLLIITILNLTIGLIIIALSSFSIAAQVMVVIFAVVAPFVFLLALIPRFSNVLGAWGAKLLGYSMIKIVISVALSLLLIMVAVIYSSVDEYGIIATLIVITIFAVTIYSSRHQIKNIIKAIPKGARHVQREARVTPGTKEKITEYKEIAKGYTKGKFSRRKTSDVKQTTTNSGRKNGLISGNKNKPSATRTTSSYNDSATSTKDMYTKQKYDEYRGLAKRKLTRDYLVEKGKANKRAVLLGTKPRYSKFVNDADTRHKLGEEKFTQAQINEEIKKIRKVEMQGEDPEKYVKGKITLNQNQEPIKAKINIEDIVKDLKEAIKHSIKVNENDKARGNNKEGTTRTNTDLSSKVDSLNNKNDELLHELKYVGNEGKSNRNQGLDNDQIEKLGEEISKTANNSQSTMSDSETGVQNINQNITVNDAKGFNGQFEGRYNIDNNEVFFENLINKYGAQNVQKELDGIKDQDDIRNPKGLLITRLKHNTKDSE